MPDNRTGPPSGIRSCRVCGLRFRGSAALPWVTVRGVPYRRCPACGYVRVDDAYLPTSEEAEARYRLHRNDIAEPGYRAYLERFVDSAILPFGEPGSRVLDFGSGPEPALASVLHERGYTVVTYDPIFAADPRGLRGRYDAVVIHEVAEHLGRPYATFARLRRRVLSNGLMAFRTRFAPEDPTEFARWWYREDPTHVGFFVPRTFEALASRMAWHVALLQAPDLAVLRPRS